MYVIFPQSTLPSVLRWIASGYSPVQVSTQIHRWSLTCYSYAEINCETLHYPPRSPKHSASNEGENNDGAEDRS